MEFLEFIFSSGWHWLGAFLMISVICATVANISIVKIENKYYTEKEIKKEDKEESTKLKRM